MLRGWPLVTGILCLFLSACGNGLYENPDLSEEQRLLLALQGTWIGTAEASQTVSGSNRLVMNISLPDDGTPMLEGLTGNVSFGNDPAPGEADPDDPGLEDENYKESILDGYVFNLNNLGIVSSRLLARFQPNEQWSPFCEAQHEIYPDGQGGFFCLPLGPGWSGGSAGNGYVLIEGPDGEEVLMLESKAAICRDVCSCDADGCFVDVASLGVGIDLDIAVDTEHGALLGTSTELGRIEASRQ